MRRATTALLALALAWPAPARGEGAGMTLEQALELAAEESEDFEVVREQVLRARLARDRAWAPILPRLTAQGTLTHADREIVFGDRILQLQDAFAGSLSATLTVFDGPAIPGIARAYRGEAAAAAAAEWTRAGLLFEVATAFYAVAAAANLVAAAERSLETAGEHRAAVEARRQAGEALGIDERRARAEVVTAEEALVEARAARASAEDYLAFLVGREPPLALAPPPEPPAPGGAAEASEESVEDRADLRAAALEVAAAEDGVTAAWMDYLPTLAVTGTYRASQNTGFSGDPDSWQIVLTLDWVLYDGGLRRATRLEEASRVREARAGLRRLSREARRQVREALRDLEAATARVRTSRERLGLAEETRSMILRRYQAGLSTSLEVTDGDDALRQADVQVVAAELDLALRRLALLHALGLDPLGREVSGS